MVIYATNEQQEESARRRGHTMTCASVSSMSDAPSERLVTRRSYRGGVSRQHRSLSLTLYMLFKIRDAPWQLREALVVCCSR